MAAVEPKLTALAPVKPVPVMVTGCPRRGPAAGLTRGDSRGGLVGELVGRLTMALVPHRGGDGDVDGARRPAGEVAVIWVDELTV